MVEGDNWFMKENKVNGGSYGAIIGVSDIEKSRASIPIFLVMTR